MIRAIADLAWRHSFVLGLSFKCRAHFFGAQESPTDVSIFRGRIERNKPIAVLAVGLESVADFLGALPENLRALCAFDFYFVVDHEMPQKLFSLLLCSELTCNFAVAPGSNRG